MFERNFISNNSLYFDGFSYTEKINKDWIVNYIVMGKQVGIS